MPVLLKIEDLTVSYKTRRANVTALLGISLEIEKGEVFGIVGESGCGKSTLSSVIGNLLGPAGNVETGTVLLDDKNILQLTEEDLRTFRAHDITFIFQDPMAVLDPTKTIGKQFKRILNSPDWEDRAREGLKHVGLNDHAQVLSSYPFQLSGGMAQRAVIAMALVRKPKLLIADEPTAALDASVRGDVMDLLSNWCKEVGAALIIVSHDIPMVTQYCNRIGVMYAGRFVEISPADSFTSKALHPYAVALLNSEPGHEGEAGVLKSLDGAPPLSISREKICAFAPRCTYRADECQLDLPELKAFGPAIAACLRLDQIKKGQSNG